MSTPDVAGLDRPEDHYLNPRVLEQPNDFNSRPSSSRSAGITLGQLPDQKNQGPSDTPRKTETLAHAHVTDFVRTRSTGDVNLMYQTYQVDRMRASLFTHADAEPHPLFQMDAHTRNNTPTDSERSSFRWVHLPDNDMSWAEVGYIAALFLQLLILSNRMFCAMCEDTPTSADFHRMWPRDNLLWMTRGSTRKLSSESVLLAMEKGRSMRGL